MSASEHSHAESGAGHHGEPVVHATFRGYMTGFVLAVVLTAIPFWLVMGDVLDNHILTIAIIVALGAVQIGVHMLFFLHVDAQGEQGWTLLSLLFTGMLIVILLVGSLWIMFHLHGNTMPAHPDAAEVRSMP